MLDLNTAVQYVKGVGPRLAELLATKGINTVEDLLYYLPFRYEDRVNPRRIAELRAGEMASLIAEVRGGPQPPTAGGDGNGNGLAQRAERLKDEALEIGRIVPVYESAGSGKLTSRWFRHLVHHVLEDVTSDIPDAIPNSIRARLQLRPRREALWQAHWPEVGESLNLLQDFHTPAQQRLIFEELYFLELGLELKRKRLRALPGIQFELNDNVRAAVKRILPFLPTAAQKKVLKEIATDMQQPSPMRRLLQGDVGSGKTIVAMQAAVIAIENGYQVALMAPTEILATQHYLSARRLLETCGYRVVLLTGSQEAEQKRLIRKHIARG